MNATEARRVAQFYVDQGHSIPVADARVLLVELDRLEALALEQTRLRTLGGIPPVPARDWGNLAYTTPPASAVDAPPLHRPTTTERTSQ